LKRHLSSAAKITVTGLLLWLVLRKLDLSHVGSRLASLDAGHVLLSAALIVFQSVLVVTWRWSRVLAALAPPAPLGRLTAFTLVGQFFNQALPSTVGGDGMRIWLLHRDGYEPGLAFRVVMAERLIGLFGLVMMALAGLPRLIGLTHGDLRGWAAVVAVAGGLAAMVAAALVLRRPGWLETRLVRRNLALLAFDVQRLFRKSLLFVLLLLASIVGQVAICVAIWSIARAYGIPLGLLDAHLILPTVFVLLIVPISIGGWGLREGVMVVALGLIGIPQSDAVLISVTYGVLVLLLGLPGGIVWLLLGAPKRAPETSV